MARSLTFSYKKSAFDAELIKIDRSRLYGSVRVLTNDVQGRRCSVATLASDGKTLIPTGGTALGYVNTVGEWIARDELLPVDVDNEPLEEVASSFDAPIALSDASIVKPEVLLNHGVRLTYQLNPTGEMPSAFQQILFDGAILNFGFSYRGGIDFDPAFILADSNKTVWMLVAEPSRVEFVGLEQASLCASEAIVDEIDNDDEDNLDFGML